VVAALSPDQLTLLRLARGDRLPRSPFERPQTRYLDRSLLVTLRLLEIHGASFELTPLGAACLKRIEAEMLSKDPWEDPFLARDAKHASG
jgi:hypothetical protein